MKQLDDIEKMDWQELETAAMREQAPVPKDLEKRIAETLTAQALAEEAPEKGTTARGGFGKRGRRVLWTAVAAAAVLAAVLALPSGGGPEPEDTFDDPYLAYAEVQKAFQVISHKMSDGLAHAAQAQDLAERPIQILQNN